MSFGSAMNTAVTGLQTSQVQLDVIGDNIANVNTTGFKASRADLETLFSLTLRAATAPGDVLGGTNPVQVGLGSNVGAINRGFQQGSVSTTGSQGDLALEGAGFFILARDQAVAAYTRDGAFVLDADGNLVSNEGLRVQGYAVGADGEIDPGALVDIVIPIGTLTRASATTLATLQGNLDAQSLPATAGSVSQSEALLTAAGVATAATPLTALIDADGNALMADGDVIAISDARKGGFVLPEGQFTVGASGGTVQDWMTFLEGTLALHTDATLGESAAVTLDDQGRLVVTGNHGSANSLELALSSITNTTQNTVAARFDDVSAAIGGGTTTGFIIYDSLGQEVNVRLRLALVSKGESGSMWRFYAESADDSDVSNALGSGTLSFDTNGNLIGTTGTALTVSRNDTGASDIAFGIDPAAVTGLADDPSEVGLADQDGLPFGTLVDFFVDRDGVITGSFSNASTQKLGQVAVATFVNPQGLKLETGNHYTETLNSGAARIGVAGDGNAGAIESGALEQSNVNLAREFIGLINASTAFSANSRVITTADELLQELLLIAR